MALLPKTPREQPLMECVGHVDAISEDASTGGNLEQKRSIRNKVACYFWVC